MKKNNFSENRKDHCIFTPLPVCRWLSDVLKPVTSNLKAGSIIFDPAVGTGNLLYPFKDDFTCVGMDTIDYGSPVLDSFIKGDFLAIGTDEWDSGFDVGLVTCNPPYNHTKESAKKYGRGNLLPELFADRIFKYFGRDQKAILFTPMGMRLNTRSKSSTNGARYRKIRDEFGRITSIVTLPLDLFHNYNFDPDRPEGYKNIKKGIVKTNIRRVETHQEILFFNMPEIDPHLMIPDWVFEELRLIDKNLG